LSAYEIFTFDFSSTVDFSKLETDTVTIKFWIYRTSPAVPAQDTVYKTVVPYSGRDIPYIENFSQNSINEEEFFTARSSATPNWNFVQDFSNAYTGNYYAQCDYSSGETMWDYMVFPPLNLIKDSVYLISFYAASSTSFENGKRVHLLLSKTGSSYDDFFYSGVTLATNIVRRSEYVQFKYYYKATETKMHFFALFDNSSASTVNLKIDRFIVVDSAAASMPDISLNNIRSNDTGLVCDMVLPQDVSVSVTNNSFLAYDTFSFLIKTDLYDTSILVVNRIKEGETAVLTLRGIWQLSTAGIHFIKVTSASGDTVYKSRYVAAPYDLTLSSLDIDNSNSYLSKREVSASIRSSTDSSLQNVRIAVAINDSVVLEKTIDLVTPQETPFVFDDSLYLPNAGNYLVTVFIATPILCNVNTFDDTLKTVLVKQDTLSVDIPDIGGVENAGVCVVYPNPATDIVYIRTAEDVRMIEVIDLYGRVVGRGVTTCDRGDGDFGSASSTSGVFTVSLKNLPVGTYILRVAGVRGNFAVKIIKKN
jgi:hypothetical protein